MARRELNGYEAISALIPGEGGYSAAIAVKALGGFEPPRFHKVLDGQVFQKAFEADQAATDRLALLSDIDAEGELVWSAT